ncbi:hypothetical protein T439DRAFT_192885 [Meredithblackwellia eburnea MCA 4105]
MAGPSSTLTPSSASWISFSPEFPPTPPTKSRLPMTPNSSKPSRSYSRPKPTEYQAPVPSSLPKLSAPPPGRRNKAPVIKDADRIDFPTVPSPQDESRLDFSNDRFSLFLSTATSVPPLSSPDSSASFSTSPSSNVSTPTESTDFFLRNPFSPNLSIHPGETDAEVEILSPAFFIGGNSTYTKHDDEFPFKLPQWFQSSVVPPLSDDSVNGGKKAPLDPYQLGVEAGGSWEDELYTSLPSINPTTPRTPRHPYYANRKSPRSPVRSRKGSLASSTRRPSAVSQLSISPTTPRFVDGSRRSSVVKTVPSSGIKKVLLGSTKKSSNKKKQKKGADLKPQTKGKSQWVEDERTGQERLQDAAGYNMEALDAFFGVSAPEGKALRCGYGGIGVQDRGGWAQTAEFRPLLRDGEDSPVLSPTGSFSNEYESRSSSDLDINLGYRGFAKRRPPPLDLSHSRGGSFSTLSNSIASNDDNLETEGDIVIHSAKTIATPSPYVFSPDPITKEIKRRASEAALRSSSEAKKGQSGLKKKKSVGNLLRAAWNNLVDGGGTGGGGANKVPYLGKQAAGPGDFF